MKNYYEILRVPENIPAQELVKVGRQRLQECSVEHIFAGKKMGIDYTEEDWKRANVRYADVIEAYQILKDEQKRAEYDRRINAIRQQRAQQQARREAQQQAQEQARTRQNVHSGQGKYEQTGQRRQENTSRQGYTGQYEQRNRATQSTGSTAQRNSNRGRYENNGTTRERRRKPKSAMGQMIDQFKEVRKEEKDYPLFERHQNLNRRVRKEFHKNVNSVPSEIVYQLANGVLHVSYEFIHQLRKLGYINEDSVPKYVFRNRKLVAAALAATLIAAVPGTGSDIQAFPTPETGIEQTQETTDTTIEETIEVVIEEPTIQMIRYYEVEKGDSLSYLANTTGVKVYEIQESNGRIGSDKIFAGETLILPYTIDRENLNYYTIMIPAKGMSCAELARQYRTDEQTIINLNEEAVAYVGNEYIIITDTAVVPNFITLEELATMQQTAAGHMMP